jgi:SAM-dependent methyltransferase
MKSYNSFPFEFEYAAHLEHAARRGYLLETSVDEAAKEGMVAQVLLPEPPEGFYLEVGAAARPYAIGTSRRDIDYVAIDGGKSEYHFDFEGWGEYDTGPHRNLIKKKAASLPAEANTRSAVFMWGDAQRLPFPDKDRTTLPEEVRNRALPVRETFMRDVLLIPGIHTRSVEKIFREQARVLTEDGMLILRETNFDMYHRHFGEGLHPNYLSLLANLELTGFRRRVRLFDTDPTFHELIRQYPGGEDNERYPSGYYLLCQQGEAGVITPKTWRQKVARFVGGLASKQ